MMNYFTGEEAEGTTVGTPFGKFGVLGYSADFIGKECVVDYHAETQAFPVPEAFSMHPMSLWNFGLEVHTGRLDTFLGQGTSIYIFFARLIAIWVSVNGI